MHPGEALGPIMRIGYPSRVPCASIRIELDNDPFDTPDNLIQARIVMLSSRVKTIDDHIIIILPLGMNVFFIVESHSHMRDGLAAKEDQIAFLHLFAFDT